MRRARPAVLAASLALLAVTPLARAGESVSYPRTTAPTAIAPPETRACMVDFDGRTVVANTCPQTCYRETWDGPVLWVENLCGRTIWIAYQFQAADGKRYRSACYELAAHSSNVVPDSSIEPLGRREVVITQRPGPGYAKNGFTLSCSETRAPMPAAERAPSR